MNWRSWPAVLGVLASCGAVDPRPEQAEARRTILATTGVSEVYDPERGVLTEAELEAFLEGGLGLDEALRLALLNNRRLQAGFARLGVGKAELVQAGLLTNPSLGLAFLLPSGGGSPQWTLDLAQSVVELWQLPRREAVARAELARDVVELSRFAGTLVADVRVAYVEAVAARELARVAVDGRDLARAGLEAARLRAEAGVASATEVAQVRSAAAVAEHDTLRAQLAESGMTGALAALLSLACDPGVLTLTEPIPEPDGALDHALGDSEALVERSRLTRLDLRASEQALEAARAQLGLEHAQRLPALDVTLSAERPELGNEPDLLLGPGVSVELPVFDSNRAQSAAARYELEARTKEHEALLAESAQAVRAAADRARAAAAAARHVERESLPAAEQGYAIAREAYELASVTTLAVLESQRALLAAREALVRGRLEVALTRIELERALGAPLVAGE